MKLSIYAKLLLAIAVVMVAFPAPMLVAMQQEKAPAIQALERAINANDLVRAENTVKRIFDRKIDLATMTPGAKNILETTREDMRNIVNGMDDTPDRVRLQKIIDPSFQQVEVKRKRNHDQVSEQRAIAQQIERDQKLKQEDEEFAKALQAELNQDQHDYVAPGQYARQQEPEALLPAHVADQQFPGQPMQLGQAPAVPAVQQAVRPAHNAASGWFKSNWRVMTVVAVVATLGAWWFFKD